MVKKINFVKYKKFQNMDLEFSSDKINIISGSNGTCKTSLLHIISNSFQEPTKSHVLSQEQKNCLEQIRNINHIFNPKIESLTKGDKQYNYPAKVTSLPLYKVTYQDLSSIEFRRHNASKTLNDKSRYRIIPKYTQGSNTSLPPCPVVYLSLTRLFPFGEFSDDSSLKKISKKLPQDYQNQINKLYKEFTHLEINSVEHQKMGTVKHKPDFVTNREGVDSNTISAGEDNLYLILTAIISLKYYYDQFGKQSILLIDEIDATLHPAFQIKLVEQLMQYATTYAIQVLFTTHSLTLIEYALVKKQNVMYFVNTPSGISALEKVDMPTINLTLLNQTTDSEKIFSSKKIPIFTEDAEARLLLEILFDYFHEKDKDGFGKIRNFFYIVDGICIGSEILKNMFTNKTIDNFKGSICMLDGDRHSSQELNNNILVLPGQDSPEKFLFEYTKTLISSSSDFWNDFSNIQNGFIIDTIQSALINKYEAIQREYSQRIEKNISTKGFLREEYKALFNLHINFMKALFGYWIKQNEQEINEFFQNLQKLFCKTGKLMNIDISVWTRMDDNG